MKALETIILIVHLITCLILIATVLLQSGKTAGLSGAIAGGAETFFGKNKGRTLDKKLATLTKIMAIVFLITSISFSFILLREKNNSTNIDQDVAGQVENNVSDDEAADNTADTADTQTPAE